MVTDTFIAEHTRATVDEAMERVRQSLQERGFGVLWHLDINEKLEEKGQERVDPFHILEVCSAPRARQALTKNQRTGYFLPCKIVVYRDAQDGRTVIGLTRPQIMTDLLHDPGLTDLAREVEELLSAAISEAAQA